MLVTKLSNAQKKGIYINVNFTNKNGETKLVSMNLRNYLQSKAVRPSQYEPADDEARKIVAKIPIDLVPKGTTEEDVAKFEELRGTVKKRKISNVDLIVDMLEQGLDVDVVNTLKDFQSKSIQTKVPTIQETPDDIKKELSVSSNSGLLDDSNSKRNIIENQGTLGAKDIDIMENENLNAVINDMKIPAAMKDQLKKIKRLPEKKKQIKELLKLK